MNLQPFREYIRTIEKYLAQGNATEPTHYPALKTLLESLAPGLIATVNPARIACGAPDFVLTQRAATIGYVEAKDVGTSLEQVEGSDQLARYRSSLTNLVLTDYLEFRWYTDGERRATARLGTLGNDGRIKHDRRGMEAVAQLLADFLAHRAASVGTPRELAERMARLAHMIRDLIVKALQKEPQAGSIHGYLAAFRETLIADLTAAQFADMYAQTIAYGLFAARCHAPSASGGQGFSRLNAAYLLPRTNPFLRRLFNHIAGPDLDDRIAWLVDDLAQLLAQADMEAILKDFGKRTAKEDPVLHFYETFLAAYDPELRRVRGVYYTPEPVVSYIVRSIDHLLKTRFGRPSGLGDPGTLILDPAVGTATFLWAVVSEIHQAMLQRGQGGNWNDYVAQRLLPRLFGFELLMAPYAMAHLKLGLLLRDTGYRFEGDQRLGIYLTNTLEEAIKKSELLLAGWISEEANAAVAIKRDLPIMVVLGNPPYSGHSANKGPWARQLVDTYKMVDNRPLGERNPKWLQDDYVKFIRFGQWRIERTGQGILAFITNHAYLDNPTFRGMRQSLMKTFTDIYVLDLHGNARKKERAPGGGPDQNVFDIQQGVAIALFVREPGKEGPAKVHHADLWGLREEKYRALFDLDITSTEWTELSPQSTFYFFVPQDRGLQAEYEDGWKVTEVFPANSVGIVTSRDKFVLDFDETALCERIAAFRDAALSDDEVRERLGLKDKAGWTVREARANLRQDKAWQQRFTRCLYRPFDIRPIFYHDAVIERSRRQVMRHMHRDNVGLLTCRQQVVPGFAHVFCTDRINECCTISNKTREIGYTFPLYLYPSEQETAGGLYGPDERRPNLNPEFVAELERRLGARFSPHPFSPLSELGEGVGGEVIRPGGEVDNPSAQRGSGGEVGKASAWRTDPQLWARLKPLARQMRKETTPAEDLLWQHLRARRLSGFRFRRQHSIERFIVDFYCREAGLVVEVEGPVHQYQQEEDRIRQAYLESLGLRVLRFSNDDVLHNTERVLRQISHALTSPSPLAERGPGGEVVTMPTESLPLPLSPLSELGEGVGGEVVTPEDIFHYAYAVFHSPTYRTRYAEFLKIDFPRLPLTSDKELFAALAAKGAELAALHLMESPALDPALIGYSVDGSHVVEKVRYDEAQRRVYINKTQYFEGVPPEVWSFHIGGYQVCQKWLDDRKHRTHRTLSLEEREHYQKIVVALAETIRLMAEIDGLIPDWPLE